MFAETIKQNPGFMTAERILLRKRVIEELPGNLGEKILPTLSSDPFAKDQNLVEQLKNEVGEKDNRKIGIEQYQSNRELVLNMFDRTTRLVYSAIVSPDVPEQAIKQQIPNEAEKEEDEANKPVLPLKYRVSEDTFNTLLSIRDLYNFDKETEYQMSRWIKSGRSHAV
jgi:hypothetical protein